MRGNTGVSSLYVLTRGIRFKRGSIVTTRSKVTKSAGVNRRYVVTNRINVMKRVAVTSGAAVKTRDKVVDDVGRRNGACFNAPTLLRESCLHDCTIFGETNG